MGSKRSHYKQILIRYAHGMTLFSSILLKWSDIHWQYPWRLTLCNIALLASELYNLLLQLYTDCRKSQPVTVCETFGATSLMKFFFVTSVHVVHVCTLSTRSAFSSSGLDIFSKPKEKKALWDSAYCLFNGLHELSPLYLSGRKVCNNPPNCGSLIRSGKH